MLNDRKSNEVLSGWKEVAAYLDVQTRTVQRWAKEHNLPVHHYPGKKGRVYAHPVELDRWRANSNGVAAIAATASAPRQHRLSVHHALWLAASFVLAAGLWLAYRLGVSPPPAMPSGIRLEGQDLIVSDAAKKDLFRYRFDLAPDAEGYTDEEQPIFLTEDLNGDRHPELLFLFHPRQRYTTPGRLICFSFEGKINWEFTPGRKVLFGNGERSTDIYYIRAARILRSTSSHSKRVLVASVNSPNWPSQVALLDQNGKLLAEYWHPGHLTHMALADLDGDGKEEAILGGVNNLAGRAALVTLDPELLPTVSSRPPEEPFAHQVPASKAEKKVLLFQKSCLSDRFEAFNRVSRLVVNRDGILVFVAEGASFGHPALIYHFDRTLSALSRITPTTQFLARHRELETEGKLDHPFSEKELEPLQRVTVRQSTGVP